MSVLIESAWPKYPDYVIDLVPTGVTARAWFGDLLLAESEHAIRLEETQHADRLYFPVADVNWELFEPTPNFTICPFKGHATYWSLTAVDPVEKDIVWTYSEPFDEVAGIEGHVCFYQERVRLELEDRFEADDSGDGGRSDCRIALGEDRACGARGEQDEGEEREKHSNPVVHAADCYC